MPATYIKLLGAGTGERIIYNPRARNNVCPTPTANRTPRHANANDNGPHTSVPGEVGVVNNTIVIPCRDAGEPMGLAVVCAKVVEVIQFRFERYAGNIANIILYMSLDIFDWLEPGADQ